MAVGQIQNLNNTVRAETGSYAGLWIDETDQHRLRLHHQGERLDGAPSPRWSPAPSTSAPAMGLVVVHAKYDFAQLQGFAAKVKNNKRLQNVAKASHALLSSGTDPLTDKLVIGFTKVTAAERAAVSAQFGATARVITAPVFTSAVGKPG